MKKTAIISECGRYRYVLTRQWNDKLPECCFILLNPSTADADKDDPTVRACIAAADSWDYGGIVIVNLFAIRSSTPRTLYHTTIDIVGKENNATIWQQVVGRDVILGWGNHGVVKGRGDEIMTAIKHHNMPVYHMGLTRSGQPYHPLWFARNNTMPTRELLT